MTDEEIIEKSNALHDKIRDVIIADGTLDMHVIVSVLSRLLGGALAAFVEPGSPRRTVRLTAAEFTKVLVVTTQECYKQMEDARRDGVIPGWETMQ